MGFSYNDPKILGVSAIQPLNHLEQTDNDLLMKIEKSLTPSQNYAY